MFNKIDQFFDELFLQINNKKLKLTSIFKQHTFQTTHNFIIIISYINNSFQYTTLFISTSSMLIFHKSSTFSVSNTFLFSNKTSSISNKNPSISNKTSQISSKIFKISNNNSLISNNNSPIANKKFFVANSISFAFSTSLIEIFTLMFINKLIINSIAQKIRLFNTSSVKTKLQQTFNYYFELRFVKNFLINSLIDLTVLFNCNLVIIKIALTLFVKTFSIDFHKPKTYKKTITNTQHKIN